MIFQHLWRWQGSLGGPAVRAVWNCHNLVAKQLHLCGHMLQMQRSGRLDDGPILGCDFLGCVMTVSRTMVFTNFTEPSAEAAAPVTHSARTGCPWHDVKAMLRQVGLRPTRQRMALGWILFGKGDRHIT